MTATIYLPALQAVGQELQAAAGPVAATVALYMLAVGIGCLCWGPVADRFGRFITYVIGGVLFLGASVGCLCAPSTNILLVFRALQGLAAASFQTTGLSVIADLYGPGTRGQAIHCFLLPMLLGPMLGAALGGALSQRWGWRCCFILLVAADGLMLPLLMTMVPETHQFFVVRRLRATNPEAARHLAEAEAIMAQPPVFSAPWVPLKHLFDGVNFMYVLAAAMTFGFMFASLTGTMFGATFAGAVLGEPIDAATAAA
ncbi:hypothetical protein OEZ85_007316 [Tetradesmus obliquus]|uniref:Major facilitator superfamily (MFS) profile domain-containing protein n=1 Tax=Tetradesmus obliquus TaxID=3088 RepID=A0ABY8TXB4_TETOB|nr:hypothetical protein OEZ85_007316 [Tetradesmus obliquus]